MKILLVQDYLRSGGTERQTVLLARGFAAAGHSVTLLTFRPGGALNPGAPAGADQPTVQALQPFDTGLDIWAPGLRRTARALAPDVVLCMGRVANSRGALLQAALPRAVVINTLRTGKPLPWRFRRSLHRTRHTVANSRAARERILAAQPLDPDRVSVIPNALVFPPDNDSASHTDALRQSWRERHGVDPRTVVLLDVAMFRPEKNQIALLDIVHRLPADAPPWQLWLAGDGPALAACRARVTALGLDPRVRFFGWLPDPAPLYAAADLAVHASRRESLSNFLIEAQAHGLPAVAYDALGVAETFAPGESGALVAMDDEAAFVREVLGLLRDPARRQAWGAHGRKFARDRFSPAASVAAYLHVFSRLHAQPPRA